MSFQNLLIPTLPSLFFTKNDSEDPRLGDHFKSKAFAPDSLQENDYVIVGYPDDEGIKLNSGRPGASEAPKLIRQFLYKMSWPNSNKQSTQYLDFGDLENKSLLELKHQSAREITSKLHQKKTKVISFGGGHDYGFSDASAFVENYLDSGEKPVVINFDAHLDVRPTTLGFNSGTPFYRLLNEYSEQIELIEIGLQPQCNSFKHREWALSKKAHLFDLKNLQCEKKMMRLFDEPVFKKIKPTTPVFISFDIDCITSSEAGGCSQSWVTGLKTQDCLHFLASLYNKSNCRGLGIYEVSPVLDLDFRTSKTAALIAYHFLFQNLI
jgi:formiminoglutamase